jgi:hypothetical protein
VLARYVGGEGKGKHYYQGISTKESYKVKYGDTVYARLADTRSEAETSNRSMLIRIEKAAPVNIPQVETVVKKVERQPRVVEPAKMPTVDLVTKAELDAILTEANTQEEIPEINLMSYAQITALELTPELATTLLKLEQEGLGRKKVVGYLSGKSKQ